MTLMRLLYVFEANLVLRPNFMFLSLIIGLTVAAELALCSGNLILMYIGPVMSGPLSLSQIP